MQKAIGIQLTTPILPLPAYANLTGESVESIRQMIFRGLLPVVYLNENTKKAKPYVNMLALTAKAADAAGMKIST